MRIIRYLAMVAALVIPSALSAKGVEVTVDASAATAVLKVVRDPNLTFAQALTIARLPGNQGLIRKARSYGRTANDDLLARALIAAAHRDTTFSDISKFNFADVRDHAAQTERALAGLSDPELHLLDTVKARIAAFTPPAVSGRVTGYLVVGGTAGGFAFGDPQFYLNLDRYPSARLASTIMEHELFHAVQALAQSAAKATPEQEKCLADIPHSGDISDFLTALSMEGTASYVGDVLALPDHDADETLLKERARFARNVGLIGRSITQLELSVHGLDTGASVSADEVYALGFYGDEVMYPLGYVMARAISKEQGDTAIGELIGLPGAAFVKRYIELKGYGKSEEMPALKPGTIRWADRLTACANPRR